MAFLDNRHHFDVSTDVIIIACDASSHETTASLAFWTLRTLCDTRTLVEGGRDGRLVKHLADIWWISRR